MNFSKNVTLTLISNAIYVVLGLTFSILVARNFGPEGKGIISLMSVISTTTLQFANLGLAGALTYFVARRMGEAKNFAASSIVFGLLWGSFVAFLIYLIHLSHPILFGAIPDKFVYIALISIPIILIGNFLNNILLGQEKIFAFNLVQVIGQLILVALGVV